MKYKYQLFLILLLMVISWNSYCQPQIDNEHQKELKFSVNTQILNIDSDTTSGNYNFILASEIKQIKNVESIYVRVVNVKGEDIFVKAIDKDVLKQEKKNEDDSIQSIFFNKEYFSLSIGPFPKGEYLVFLQVRDEEDLFYFNVEKINLE